MCLLDSNAIAIIIKRLGPQAVETLKERTTLDLARYELGNVIWKECILSRIISSEEAAKKAGGIAELMDIMKILRTETPHSLRETMKLATELQITFYDATYLYHAKNEPPLVTEDNQLRIKAKQVNIKAITVNQLLQTG